MKIKANNTLLLTACVVILALLCVLSVDAPMRFQHQRAEREAVVRQRMQKISAAEKKYLTKHGAYAGSFDTLVKGGYLADSLTYIPYSDDERFTLRASIGGSGEMAEPRLEISAGYEQYLNGLDKASISNLIDEANGEGRFPGITN